MRRLGYFDSIDNLDAELAEDFSAVEYELEKLREKERKRKTKR